MPEVMIQFTREFDDRDDEEGSLGPFTSEAEALAEWESFTAGIPGMILCDVQMIDVANPRPIPGWLGVGGLYVEPEDVAPKRRRFRVWMTRDRTERAVFEVEATDPGDAERKAHALACAGGGAWDDFDTGAKPYVEYPEDDIEEIRKAESA